MENICNNCGLRGHLIQSCKSPIISYGIIAVNLKAKKYLMVRRQKSFGYIEFMLGKYNLQNFIQIQDLIDEMSMNEKDLLLNYDFEYLWTDLWENKNYSTEEIVSKKKLDLLKEGFVINDEVVSLQYFINHSTTQWSETEWEFPKGRKNYQEKILECSLREFSEETGYSKNDIKSIENVMPFEEVYVGSNMRAYKHKYYLSVFINDPDIVTKYQISEVSKVEWKTIDECLECIRPYNLEKKGLITQIHHLILNYEII